MYSLVMLIEYGATWTRELACVQHAAVPILY